MTNVRSAAIPVRAAIAVLLALLLALRLLMPDGFMPSFKQGAVTIIACPDVGPAPNAAPMAGHHHHGPSKLKSDCPYAAGAGLGGLASDQPLLLALLTIGTALLLGRAYAFIERHRAHERPPLRGPPIPA